jgi:hypothetical protein
MDKDDLILKRAAASRRCGDWNDQLTKTVKF